MENKLDCNTNIDCHAYEWPQVKLKIVCGGWKLENKNMLGLGTSLYLTLSLEFDLSLFDIFQCISDDNFLP